MSEKEFEQPNLCEHGNFKDSCALCQVELPGQEKALPHEEVPKSATGGNESPEAVADEGSKVDQESLELAPEGWMNASKISRLVDRDPVTIQKISEPYREIHPEWFKILISQKGRGNRATEHYSPELVQIISDESKLAIAPEGWVTRYRLAAELGCSYKRVEVLAETYRQDHPDWFANYDARSGGVLGPGEYLSPELVQINSVEIQQLVKAPEGWMTIGGLASSVGHSHGFVEKMVGNYRESHPGWFGEFQGTSGAVFEHFSPELVEKIRSEIAAVPEAPEGWMVNHSIAKSLGRTADFVGRIGEQYRDSHPEWFKVFSIPAGHRVEHYSPELVSIITSEFQGRKPAPEGWMAIKALAKLLQRSGGLIPVKADGYRDKHPEWFAKYEDADGRLCEHYSPELVARITSEIGHREQPPTGWKNNHTLSGDLQISFNPVKEVAERYRSAHPEWFATYQPPRGKPVEYYSPELVAIVSEELKGREKAPAGWMTNWALSKLLSVQQNAPETIAERYRTEHPEWFHNYLIERGMLREHYAPELVQIITREILGRESPPAGWLTGNKAAEKIGTSPQTFKKIADQYRDSHPEWFNSFYHSAGRPSEHCSPELIAIVQQELSLRPSERDTVRGAESFIQQISQSGTTESKEFQELVGVFGSSRAVDILYRMNPQFQGVPVDRVHGMIAEYLGDFLLIKTALHLDDIPKLDQLRNYLADKDLRAGLLEVVKESCLHYYQAQQKENPEREPEIIIREYFENLRRQVAQLTQVAIGDIVDRAEAYYVSLFEEEKRPNAVVEKLRDGRAFPDINQRINIKEIFEKKKMLIADEMGLGKSASAILSKEYLGVKCALLVVPSNVIPTWQRYLSDEVGEDGRQVGYFKTGMAPKVCTIENSGDLNRDDLNSFDYVLISQERLSDKYVEGLQQLAYEMLIIDETHKLKNIMEGKRSQHALDLAKRLEGDDKYLVTLSGTPVPNKVGDVALTLKMLYPEKFEKMKGKDLVRSIIYGDVVEVRNLLVPRMQLKRLQESLEMPPLEERTIPVELSQEEAEIYSILLEEDELTAPEKIAALRKFLLNPELLRVCPDIKGSKIQALNESLKRALEQHQSVIVFVNGYVEDVIRGDASIVGELSLPDGVEVNIIDGTTPQEERQRIQEELRHDGKKRLIFVSGQTADVGVDFSQADHVIHYNEPWTAYDKAQQVSRVYREGHEQALESETLLTRNTIEDGIHRYIAAKRKAIEKLLHGIPRTELENHLLELDEKQVGPNLEVNPELAEYYFSSWDRMMRIFSHVRELGEAEFKRFLDQHGEDYADCYTELGGRTYQANNSRLVASLIAETMSEQGVPSEKLRILDIASGPEMLKRHLPERLQDSVISIDINAHHFTGGRGKKVVGSFLHLPFQDNAMDQCNLALSLHYTKFAPSRGEFERLRVLAEMNRVLKTGGRGTVSMIYNIDFKDPKALGALIHELGFRIVEEQSGMASARDSYRANILTLEKTRDIPEIQAAVASSDENVLNERLGKAKLEGLKFKRSKTQKLKNSRKIVNAVTLSSAKGARAINIEFNDRDQKTYLAEEQALQMGNAMKSRYHKIEHIPEAELVRHGFSRLLAGKRYLLFKKLDVGEGAVVIR